MFSMGYSSGNNLFFVVYTLLDTLEEVHLNVCQYMVTDESTILIVLYTDRIIGASNSVPPLIF